MATSSGNSSQIQNSGMDDERKRKRMESNRESARRSRMRKQKHLDDLMGEMAKIEKENNQIIGSINLTTQHLANIEAENSILRAQMEELSLRLQSLNEIINYTDFSNDSMENEAIQTSFDHFINPLNMGQFYHPILASADMLQY